MNNHSKLANAFAVSTMARAPAPSSRATTAMSYSAKWAPFIPL